MTKHLERDLAHVKQLVLAMGGLVEQSLEQATVALVRNDENYARRALAADREIDRKELEIDEECLKVLALHQPVAGDLCFITATMKITNDLERIGDLAGSLAERALYLLNRPPLDERLAFEEMVAHTRQMLRDGLDALISENSELAREVCTRDDKVDDFNRQHFEVLQERMKRDPGSVEAAVALLSASRHIERIADLATNIAEDVVFLVEAEDIRHPSLADEPD